MAAGRDIRLGLVGAGRWGRNYVHTIGRLTNVSLAWIADPAPSAAATFGEQYPIHADWRTAIGGGDVDGIIVATPPHLHAEITGAAVDQGLAVLVEKPLTTSPQQARDLLTLAERQGGLAWVDHVHLFAPGYRLLREAVAPLRPIRRIASRGGRWGPFRDDASVLWDWGPHDVAFCLDLVGETPIDVTASRRERRETPEGTGEILDIGLAFPGGAQATLTIGNIFAEKHRDLTVVCDRATLVLDDTAENKLTQRPTAGGAAPQPIPFVDEPPLACAVRGFAEAIRDRTRDLAPLRLGASVVETLDACERLLSEGSREPSHPRP